MSETLAHGYSSESTQGELSNEYQHHRVKMVFKSLHALWMTVATAYEGLKLKLVKKKPLLKNVWKMLSVAAFL